MKKRNVNSSKDGIELNNSSSNSMLGAAGTKLSMEDMDEQKNIALKGKR
jgi:hypothetical protein